MTSASQRDLPKNYEPRQAEDRWQAFWVQNGYFHADNESVADPYTIVIPPPNVTGALHVGHGLVQTIQDLLIRHHRMAEDNTLWVPGTDHAGIATQHVVVNKLHQEGKRREDLGREGFLKEAWRWKEEYHGRITGQIKRLGCSCDWEREAFTLDDERARAVRIAFKHLYDKGLIYRGLYMVNWDPVSLTALADDEVEYEEEQGSLWHMKYPFADGSGRFAIVATTRPETMLGDTAVAVNPSDERYQDVIGQEVELPLTGRRIPIVADDFVAKDFGSGMVKITPAHDPNDFLCGQRHNMEQINIFTPDAKINKNAPEKYRGMDRYDARAAVVEDLKALGLMEKIEKHVHRVGRGYRSKAIVEPRLSDQWFVKVGPLAERAAKAVRDGEVHIYPKQQENTYFHWMENVRDWCISRQLWWGHRIPVWYRKDDPSVMVCYAGEGQPPEVTAEPDAWEQDADVLDTWFSSALWPFSTLGWPDENAKDLKVYFPTSVLVTGHDILFFWVARMIMMSYELTGQKPFDDVFLHGLVFGKSYYRRRGGDLELISPKERDELQLDERGEDLPKDIEFKWEKMSKSKGNVIDPLDACDEFGVDSLRSALVAYSGQGRTIEIDKQRIAGYRNFINKLWNASRFIITATGDVTPEQFRGGLLEDGLQREDRWIVTRLGECIDSATAAIRRYDFDQYVQAMYRYLRDDYCDWYLELIKGRVYGKDAPADSPSSVTAKVTALGVLEQILRLLHPLAPHATEEIWQLMREQLAGVHPGEPAPHMEPAAGKFPLLDSFDAPSLCIARWPKNPGMADSQACGEVEVLQQTIYAIRNIRGEMDVPPAMKVEVHAEHPGAEARAIIESAGKQIRSLATVSELKVAESLPEPPFASTYVSGDLTIRVPLPEELREQERARLEKEIARVEKGWQATNKKLSNERFVQNAPDDVVNAEREKLARYQQDIDAMKEKLAALQG